MSFKISQLKNIVFAGGGVRGISYSGALLAFEDTFKIKVSQHFQVFAGASVGSLYALICCLGLEVSTLPHVLQGPSSSSGTILSDIFMKDPTWLISNYALNSGESLKHLVERILEMGQCDSSTTFSELYKKTGKKLVVAVVDILSAKVFYLDHTNEGSDMPILNAIMGSMALPPLFPPVAHPSAANSLNTKLLMVDGGLLNSFIVDQFEPSETLGLKTSWYISPGNPLKDIASYYSRLLSIVLIPIHKIQDEKRDALLKVIHIDLGHVKIDASDIDVQNFIFVGYRCAIAAFSEQTNYIDNPTKYLSETSSFLK